MMDDLRNEFAPGRPARSPTPSSSARSTWSGWRPTRCESQERIENLLELIGSMQDFEREAARAAAAHDYLEQVSLVAPADAAQKGVTLMTVHAAKGLEFPVVFVTGLEDGVFPSLRNGEDEAVDEERRLATSPSRAPRSGCS